MAKVYCMKIAQNLINQQSTYTLYRVVHWTCPKKKTFAEMLLRIIDWFIVCRVKKNTKLVISPGRPTANNSQKKENEAKSKKKYK